MIRIVEILIASLIVALLGAAFSAMLPAHGHIERRVEVSNPLRQAYDSVNTLRRYPQWSGFVNFDPAMKMGVRGADFGPGAHVDWESSSPKVGNGSLEIVSNVQDEQVKLRLENDWIGTNKTFTYTLVPSANARTVSIRLAYDVDYGWNLFWRFGGLYINGDPAAVAQDSLNALAALIAGYPNSDYSSQEIELVDVEPTPVFLVNTRAPRMLDEIELATSTALGQINAALAKTGLSAAGPRMTITINWDQEDYTFAVAVPVDATTLSLGGNQYALETPVRTSDEGSPAPTAELQPGQKDDRGLLVVDENVRAGLWYGGKALVSEYTGSPAALPAYRLNLRAYAEAHGYSYNEYSTLGRFWDALVSPPETPADEQEYKVYLPVQL